LGRLGEGEATGSSGMTLRGRLWAVRIVALLLRRGEKVEETGDTGDGPFAFFRVTLGEASKGGWVGGTGDAKEERVRRRRPATAVAAAGDRVGPDECRCGLPAEIGDTSIGSLTFFRVTIGEVSKGGRVDGGTGDVKEGRARR